MPKFPDGSVDSYLAITLFDKDAGDTRLSDRGWSFHDVLLNDSGFGRRSGELGFYSSATVNGEVLTLLELLDGIGLTCRPLLNLKNTNLANFTVGGGSWDTIYPNFNNTQDGVTVSRLHQYDLDDGVQWDIDSNYSLPQNPHVVFEIVLPESPADWDGAANPRYARIELGGRFAIHFNAQGVYLLYHGGGSWRAVQELPNPSPGGGYGARDSILCSVRCLRGKILISFDLGKTQTIFAWPDGSDVTIPGGPWTFRGQGGEAYVGIHQIEYRAGYYECPPQPTFTSRGLLATATVTGRGNAPFPSTVTLSDRSTPTQAIAKYRALLTPGVIAGTPFAFYVPPVHYSTTLRYPTAVNALSTASTARTQVVSAHVSKPLELNQSSASWREEYLAGDMFTGDFRKRKARIQSAFVTAVPVTTTTTLFTGYITQVTVSVESFGKMGVEFQLGNILTVLEEEWGPTDVRPLGGMTLAAAVVYILESEGFDSSYVSFALVTGTPTLPFGFPEDPFELIRPGERKRETLFRICGYYGYTVAATDAGTITLVPINYVSATQHQLRWTTSTVTQLIQSIELPVDYCESATCIVVQGRNETNGQPMLAWARDADAEDNPLSPRFTQKRVTVNRTIPGTTSVGLLTSYTALLSQHYFALRADVQTKTFLRGDISRRDQALILGADLIGLSDDQLGAFAALNHRWELSSPEGVYTLETEAVIRV